MSPPFAYRIDSVDGRAERRRHAMSGAHVARQAGRRARMPMRAMTASARQRHVRRRRCVVGRRQPWEATFRGTSRPGAAAYGSCGPGRHRDSRGWNPGTGRRGGRAGRARSAVRSSCQPPFRDRNLGASRASARTRGPHRRERVVEPGLGRAEGDAQGGRDFGQRHPQEVVQGDDRSLTRIEPRGGRRRGARGRRGRRRRPAPRENRGASDLDLDGRRRRRRARSRQAFTVSRYSQASNRSGSRNPGRSRQARMSASWTASRASSGSRRISRAAASSRAMAMSTSTAKAS